MSGFGIFWSYFVKETGNSKIYAEVALGGASDRDYPSEENAWCEDLEHGIGFWLYEYPIINRLWSFDYPMTLEKGMILAVEAMEYDPEVGRTK